MNGDTAQVLTDIVQIYGGLMLRCPVSFLGKELRSDTVAVPGACRFY